MRGKLSDRRARVSLTAAALAAISVLGAGCGDDEAETTSTGDVFEGLPETTTAAAEEPETNAAAGPDPCRLVPQERVDELIGAGSEPERDEQFGLDSCVWEAPDPEDAAGPSGVKVAGELLVTLGETSAFDQYSETAYSGEKPVAVNGIGEKAVIVPGTVSATSSGTGGRSIVVLETDRTVVVSLEAPGKVGFGNEGDTDPDDSELEELAQEVLGAI